MLATGPVSRSRTGWCAIAERVGGRGDLALIAPPSARDSRRSRPRSTRIRPWKIACQSEENPKKTSEVGIVERNPTLRKSSQRLPRPPASETPARITAAMTLSRKVVAGARVERPDRGGEEHAGEADEAARRDERREAGLAQRDAARLRREAVAADRDGAAAVAGARQEEADDEHQRPPSATRSSASPSRIAAPEARGRRCRSAPARVWKTRNSDGEADEVGGERHDDRVELAEDDDRAR